MLLLCLGINSDPFRPPGSRLTARWSSNALHTWQTGVYRHRAPPLLPHAPPSPCSCPCPLQPPASAQPPLQPHTQGRRRMPQTHSNALSRQTCLSHTHTSSHSFHLIFSVSLPRCLFSVKCLIFLSLSHTFQTSRVTGCIKLKLPSVVHN